MYMFLVMDKDHKAIVQVVRNAPISESDVASALDFYAGAEFYAVLEPQKELYAFKRRNEGQWPQDINHMWMLAPSLSAAYARQSI